MKVIDLRTRDGKQSFYQWGAWRNKREEKLCNDPFCEECLKKDKITPATEVHHIIDISDKPTLENALDYNNLMSLCKSCHSTITCKKPKAVWKPFNLKEFLSIKN